MLVVPVITEARCDAAAVHEAEADNIGAHHHQEGTNHHGQLLNERSLLKVFG